MPSLSARPTRWPRWAMVLTLAWMTVASIWSAPPDGLAQEPPTPTPTAPLPDGTPAGTWRAVHAPGIAPLFSGNDIPTFNAVHGVALGDGGYVAWAVGDECTLARNDGSGWQRVDALASECTFNRTYDLRDIFVVGPDDAWAVGRYTGGNGLERDCVAEEPADRMDVDFEEGCGMVVRLSATGWEIQHYNDIGLPRPAPPLNGLDMIYDEETERWYGWAAGNDAEFDSLKAIILQYLDDGEGPGGAGRWRHTSVSRSTNINQDLRAVKILSRHEAWIVGEDGNEAWYKATEEGAGDWGARGKSGRDHLYALDMTDPLYGWDGGWRGRMNNYVGFCHDDDPETACWFDNKGQPLRFPPSTSVQTNAVYGIELIRRGVGWTVGEASSSRSLVAYLQPDLRWHAVPVQDDPAEDLHGVWFLREERGWAVGAEGVILAYEAPDGPVPSATPTVTETPVESTETPTAPVGPSVTPSDAATDTPSPSATPTLDGSASPTPEAGGPSITPTALPSGSPSPEPTRTPSPDASPTRVSPGGGTIYLPMSLRRVRPPR